MKITITIYLISILALFYSISNKSDIAEVTFMSTFFIAFIKMGIDAWKSFLSQSKDYLSKYEINHSLNIDQGMKLKIIDINKKIEYQKGTKNLFQNYIYIQGPTPYTEIYIGSNYDAPAF